MCPRPAEGGVLTSLACSRVKARGRVMVGLGAAAAAESGSVAAVAHEASPAEESKMELESTLWLLDLFTTSPCSTPAVSHDGGGGGPLREANPRDTSQTRTSSRSRHVFLGAGLEAEASSRAARFLPSRTCRSGLRVAADAIDAVAAVGAAKVLDGVAFRCVLGDDRVALASMGARARLLVGEVASMVGDQDAVEGMGMQLAVQQGRLMPQGGSEVRRLLVPASIVKPPKPSFSRTRRQSQ